MGKRKPMRIYLIRHASPDYRDDTLTEEGHNQARMLAMRLKAEEINKLYSSPLGRALDTARYASNELGLPITIEEWIKEIDLTVEDTWGVTYPAQNVSGCIIRGTLPLPNHYDWYTRPPFNGKDMTDLHNYIKSNSDKFLGKFGHVRQDSVYRIVKACDDKIAVFGHHGSGLAWLSHLLEIPLSLMWSGFFIAFSSVTVIEFDEQSPGYTTPRCTLLGDISHFYHKIKL